MSQILFGRYFKEASGTKLSMRAVFTGALPIMFAASILSTASLALAETISSSNTGNQPAILSSASVVLTETNSVLRASGRLSISDADSAQTFMAQSNVAGAYGTFKINSAGAWAYVANSNLDRLNVGQSVSDSFMVASADGTTTSVQGTIYGR